LTFPVGGIGAGVLVHVEPVLKGSLLVLGQPSDLLKEDFQEFTPRRDVIGHFHLRAQQLDRANDVLDALGILLHLPPPPLFVAFVAAPPERPFRELGALEEGEGFELLGHVVRADLAWILLSDPCHSLDVRDTTIVGDEIGVRVEEFIIVNV
jgi:hypothetical protein